MTDRISTYALYTDPPLGRIGMTEAEVRNTGKPAETPASDGRGSCAGTNGS